MIITRQCYLIALRASILYLRDIVHLNLFTGIISDQNSKYLGYLYVYN